MRRIRYVVLIGIAMSFNCTTIIAQIKNHTAEDFEPGTHLVFQTCEDDGANILPGGENKIWDYTGLKKKENDTTIENMVDPKACPYGNQFPKANLVEQYSNGKYVFIRKTAPQSFLLGYIDSANAMNATYEKPVLIAQRPIAFGDKVKDSFTTAYSIQKMDFKGAGEVTIEADGYGTLLLPDRKYKDVIRLKISQIQKDTLIQYSSPGTTQITTYVWFDNTHKSALLKITDVKSGNYSSKNIEYLLHETVNK